jgi:predicted ATPase/DNA-binding XRE family transcriptional regulator
VTFGGWLRQRRSELGITRDELSERLGFSLALLAKLESGERRPSHQIALLLADYFGIPVDEREAFVLFARSARATPTFGEAAWRTPWRTNYAHQTNLPIALAPIIGRESELAALQVQLLHARTRLLTLIGPPGIGKTRLALQVASALLEHFEDGVYFVDLAPIVDPDEVLSTVARALQIKELENRSAEEVLFEHAREKRMLLALDNFEQVLDAAPQVARLLASCPWLKIMVTSREALHLRGERRYPVPPLEVPGSRFLVSGSEHGSKVQEPGTWNLEPETLLRYSAVQLFVESAREAAPDFALTQSNAEDVVVVCMGLEGLPLAIELAAARAAHLTPREMRAALDDRLRLLTEGARDLPPRQRTLRAAIEWSYDLLTDEERAVFRRLGVFVGGFTREAAEAVCSREGDRSLAQLLTSLEAKNLIRGELQDEAEVFRFAMLETLREYALERLWESGEAEATESKHARYFMRLAEEAESHLTGSEQAEWLDGLERERDNLRAAIRWARENSKRNSGSNETGEGAQAAEIGLRLTGAIGRFWYIRGYYSEGRDSLAEALAAATSPTLLVSPFRAKALSAAGMLVTVHGDYGSGRSLHEESLAIRREIGDKRGIGISLNHLGTMAHEQGDYATARSLFEESLAIRREIGDTVGESIVLSNLSSAVQQQGDNALARAMLEESLAIKRKIGHKESLANSLNNLGTLLVEEGDYERARSLYEESLSIRREIGGKRGMASSLSNLGDLAYRQGDYAKARTLFEESLTINQEISDNISIPSGLIGLGAVAIAMGELERGARLLGAASKLGEAMGVSPVVATRQVYELSIASAQAQLGEEAFAQAWAEGRAMTVERAIAVALGS